MAPSSSKMVDLDLYHNSIVLGIFFILIFVYIQLQCQYKHRNSDSTM